MSGHSLKVKLGRLLILETKRLELEDSMSLEDWKEYRHLRAEHEHLYHMAKKEKRISYQHLRRALEDGVI